MSDPDLNFNYQTGLILFPFIQALMSTQCLPCSDVRDLFGELRRIVTTHLLLVSLFDPSFQLFGDNQLGSFS